MAEEILYKYLPPERVDYFESEMLRFSPREAFNDPFEFRCRFVGWDNPEYEEFVFKKNVEREFFDAKHWNDVSYHEFYETCKKDFEENMAQNSKDIEKHFRKLENLPDSKFAMGIVMLCLSEIWDEILMWSHYSQSHKGFVLGFHQDRLQPEDGRKRGLEKIVYQKNLPDLDVTTKSWAHFLKRYRTKSSEWKYEKEWRLFEQIDKADDEIKLATGASVLLYRIPFSSLKEVVFGLDFPENEIPRIIDILRKKGLKKQLRVFRAKLKPDQYRIIREKIKW